MAIGSTAVNPSLPSPTRLLPAVAHKSPYNGFHPTYLTPLRNLQNSLSSLRNLLVVKERAKQFKKWGNEKTNLRQEMDAAFAGLPMPESFRATLLKYCRQISAEFKESKENPSEVESAITQDLNLLAETKPKESLEMWPQLEQFLSIAPMRRLKGDALRSPLLAIPLGSRQNFIHDLLDLPAAIQALHNKINKWVSVRKNTRHFAVFAERQMEMGSALREFNRARINYPDPHPSHEGATPLSSLCKEFNDLYDQKLSFLKEEVAKDLGLVPVKSPSNHISQPVGGK